MEAGIAERGSTRVRWTARIDQHAPAGPMGAPWPSSSVLWATMLFALFTMWPLIEDDGIKLGARDSRGAGAGVQHRRDRGDAAALHRRQGLHLRPRHQASRRDASAQAASEGETTWPYQPPKQSIAGADRRRRRRCSSLTVGALYLPLYLGLAGAAKTPTPIDNPTWEALGQNAAEQQQWAALGYRRCGVGQRHHHRPLRLHLQLDGADRHGRRWSSAISFSSSGFPTRNTAKSSTNASATTRT